MKKVKNEKGFTLIEMVVVIVILGIISVIAVPRYLSLIVEAEEGTARGITASLRGAIAIQHARYLMDRVQTYDATSIIGAVDTEDITLSNSAAVITAEFDTSGTEYTWTYTDADTTDDIPATVQQAGF
jgi:prepilin-type N-terminal cleavage/methylation domain-containing protein